MHGGDSALAQRLTQDLNAAIANKTEALIAAPSERLAGEIRGMQDAVLMIGVPVVVSVVGVVVFAIYDGLKGLRHA